MKQYEVRMTMTVSVTVCVEAEDKEAAEKMAMEKTGNNPACYLRDYDSVLEREVTEVEEFIDDNPKKPALDYVRSQLDEWRLEEYRAEINSAYEYHTTPTAYADFDRIRDLLEEYGADNDLPEGWWMNEGDLDDWLYEL